MRRRPILLAVLASTLSSLYSVIPNNLGGIPKYRDTNHLNFYLPPIRTDIMVIINPIIIPSEVKKGMYPFLWGFRNRKIKSVTMSINSKIAPQIAIIL